MIAFGGVRRRLESRATREKLLIARRSVGKFVFVNNCRLGRWVGAIGARFIGVAWNRGLD